MFTGRSTVGMLLSGLVLPGTNARSGMNDPNGTFMKRLLSISHTEQTGCWACAAEPNRHPSAAIAAVQNLSARLLIAFLPMAKFSLVIEIGMRLAFSSSNCPLVRLVLPRPQHFADAQHIFRGLQIQPVGDIETLLVAVLGEFQHLGG